MNLAGSLAPVAARVIAQFSGGATARLRVSAPTRQADGSSSTLWADVVGLTAAPFIAEDLGAERALKVWGAEKTVTLQVTVALPVGLVLAPVGLALAISGGLRTGTRWTVVGIKTDETSRTAVLALQATRDLLGLP